MSKEQPAVSLVSERFEEMITKYAIIKITRAILRIDAVDKEMKYVPDYILHDLEKEHGIDFATLYKLREAIQSIRLGIE